ncbi:MAG: hypothetical protein ACFE9Q_14615 [Candidatus Hodarchaeota archaeon]
MRIQNLRKRFFKIIFPSLILIFIIPIMHFYILPNLYPIPLFRYDNLEISQSDIDITTPENKTYTKPMSGYYPGVFGFENDIFGNVPSNWTENSGSNCSALIIDTLDGHKNILDCFDNSSSNYFSIETAFSNQSYGTIEFWIRTTNSTAYTDIDFLISGTQVFTLIIENDQFNYWNGSAMNYIANAYNNLWDHIRIDFECTTGGYQGLSQYHYKVSINDVDYGVINFWRNRTYINRILIKSTYPDSAYHSYFDAFGYSWDPSYNIGDNKKEGILLSFTPDVLDWVRYSLDGQINKTILGNTTIPIPKNGLHSVQIFGSYTGTLINSDTRYFIVLINPFMEIVTPQNQTYYNPMSGFYPGTYGFENDNIGDLPYSWEDSSGDDCSVQVIDSLDGHNYVLDCFDNSSSDIAAIDTAFSNQSYGTIEFWIRTTNSTAYTDIDFLISGTQVFTLIIENDQFNYWNGSAMNYIANAYNNQWAHIRIDFECTTGGYQGLSQYHYKVYINDVDYGVINFWRNRAYVNRILIKSKYPDSAYHSYFDAFAYSWDQKYNIGDNKKEGLLLSFKSNTSLKWMGYSLDGMVDKQILGNTTIVIPEDGLRTIRVIGIDLLGNVYYSNMQYFSVFQYPIIVINSPNQFEIYEKEAPSYNISILGQGLDTFWYTLDVGIINLTFTGLIGNIDQNEWDKKQNGIVIIRFYANNTKGFERMAELVVIKCISKKAVPRIPGYNLWVILAGFSIVLIIPIVKRLKT